MRNRCTDGNVVRLKEACTIKLVRVKHDLGAETRRSMRSLRLIVVKNERIDFFFLFLREKSLNGVKLARPKNTALSKPIPGYLDLHSCIPNL